MSFFKNIDWSMPAWDFLIIAFFLIVAFAYGSLFRKDRVASVLVSIYMALAIVNTAPYINSFSVKNSGVGSNFTLKLIIFLIIFIGLFFVLARGSFLRSLGFSLGGKKWQVIIFSFLSAGLLLSIIFSFIPSEASKNLLPLTKKIFISDLGKFLWITTPIVAMVLFKSRSGRGRPPLIE
jgi:hypothetical protein